VGDTAVKDNPYQSPATESSSPPPVEVVFRKTWVGRNYEQVYRFECGITDQDMLIGRITNFYLRHNTRLLSSSGGILVFERTTSRFQRIFSGRETMHAQSIHVSPQNLPSGSVVTCHYRARVPLPTFVIPPHYLEKEVQELADECSQGTGTIR
jgi:hypothetical protein